jgi:hypothetical protein
MSRGLPANSFGSVTIFVGTAVLVSAIIQQF